MQNIPATKISLLGIFISFLILITSNATAATQKTTNWLDEQISISFQNETLSEVLKQISEQTGISIAYDQELANEKVTGTYQNVKTSDAITRLFKSKNKSIQVNKNKKTIIVKTFGAKKFIWARGPLGQKVSLHMTLGEIEKMHAQQYKEYKERISNDNEVLEGGKTRGELKFMHNKQYASYKAYIDNDEAPLKGDLNRAEIRTMHDKQYTNYRQNLMNPNHILEGGMTRGEVRALHKQQADEFQKNILDDHVVLDNGMTRGELRKMHTKQYDNYKKRLRNE